MSATAQESPTTSRPRGCLPYLALALCLPAAALLWAFLKLGLSGWSAALGAGLGLLGLGGCARGLGVAGASRWLGAGAGLLLAPWLLRSFIVKGSEQARLSLMPEDSGPRLLDKLYPERDGTLLAASALGALAPLRDPESAQFPEILAQAFARSDATLGAVPTPAIATYLGLQGPAHFDTLVISPPAGPATDAAVIFLHGYAGNFQVYCWEMAQAAAAANLLTLCPSLGPSGAWWTEQGEQTLGVMLEQAHRMGINRVYLAGLSNGAAGASELALAHTRELAGLVLVSGTRATRPPSVPTLVIQGASDEMMPAAVARAYAARAPNAQYRELAGGHLIFLSRYTQVRPLIAEFLLRLEQRAPGSPAYVSKPKH